MAKEIQDFPVEHLQLLPEFEAYAESQFKRILVPVDFSDCSNNAVNYAIAIGMHTGAIVDLIHAVHFPVAESELMISADQELEKHAEIRMENLRTSIRNWLVKNRGVELAIEYQVRIGLAGDLIRIAAEANSAETLIVMGTQGASGLGSTIIGSVTSHVIGKTACPILAVPEDARFSGFSKIVYATDWTSSDEHAIGQLVDFARLFGSEVHLVHVLTSNEDFSVADIDAFEANIDEKANYENLFFHIHVAESSSVEKELQYVVERTGADLLAMLTRNKSFFERIFSSSLTRKIAMHSETPLLAFHE